MRKIVLAAGISIAAALFGTVAANAVPGTAPGVTAGAAAGVDRDDDPAVTVSVHGDYTTSYRLTGQTATTRTYGVSARGSLSGFGSVTGSGTVTVDVSRPDRQPAPATRTDTYTDADGHTLTIRSTGTMHTSTLASSYTSTVVGGTGKYSGATGSGLLLTGLGGATEDLFLQLNR